MAVGDVTRYTGAENVYGSSAVDSSTSVGSGSSSATAQGSVPEVKSNLSEILNETPNLTKPSSAYADMNFVNLGALSNDAIMSMLGFEERKSAVSSGITEIETKREQRHEANQLRIQNLHEQAEKAAKSSLLDKIKEVFSYIGMALSAIGSLAGMAVSIATGNIALGIGSALLLLSSVEQIMSAASDGELSLANGFAEAAKATGGNEDAARISGMLFSVGLGLAGAILSGGAGVKNAVSQGMSAVKQIANNVNTAVNFVSAVNSVGTGAVGIAKSVYDSQLTKLKAGSLDIEAILQRIQTASDMDTNQLKKIMEKSQDMAEGVKNILDDCNQTLGAVVTSAPSMA
ncbi:MAG: hypothetical protein IAB19_08010 [Proteobacteria bacterium]|uniref:Secretion system effector C (SseC) like family protein n=1 Tax=Candidatus Avisuccinivibrio stercorigallinarum TaxID=2840704 RepID=A0A9D9DAS6_9GAMM|nr:hypothetical protein [Candidatus Avisuccinivibrio stercorigallinarum]